MTASARKNPSPTRGTSLVEDAGAIDLEVPAAVVCATCGEADCGGCKSGELSRSGIVTVVPWERPGARSWNALWETARATTHGAEAFFELLPDGPVAPALSFAILCELLAATTAVLSVLPLAALVAPGWLSHVVFDAAARDLALRLMSLAIPSLAILLVMAHAAHGWSLDRGARRAGAPSSRSRALRFGLYATGWDLVIGPVGAVVLSVKHGLRAALDLLTLAPGLPSRAARAFLRGAYRLQGRPADEALASSFAVVVAVTLVSAILCLIAVVAILVATS